MIPAENPPSPAAPRLPATACEKAAWILMALGLVFIMEFHLLSALLAGLFVHALIYAMAKRMQSKSLSHRRAKLVAVALIGLVIVGVTAALVLLLIAFLKGHLGNLPKLLDKMAAIIETARERLGGAEWIPAAEQLKESFAKGLREHAQELEHAGGEAGKVFLHALIGMVVGALVAFETRRPDAPFSMALSERLARLAASFDAIIFAQVRISFVNTVLTALYLLVALPLFGVELPLRKTMVIVTFIVGLIPVVGNLVSNAIIVIIALGTSATVAVASLIFLIVIHKLEYFLNAKIMGGQIHAATWELLLAMLLFEAAFGLPGVIVAPIAYAYTKRELADRALI